MTVHENFRVIRRSENTNSFGLRQFMVMSHGGEVYQIHGNHLHDMAIGDVINGRTEFSLETKTVDDRRITDHKRLGDARFDGFEMVERLADIPKDLLPNFHKEFWK